MNDLAAEIERNVSAALAEDVGNGDLTALLTPADGVATAKVISRADTVICGQPWLSRYQCCSTVHCPGTNFICQGNVLCMPKKCVKF